MPRCIIILLLLILSCTSHAAYDPELATSLKCVALFKHHEQKYRIPRDTLHSISLQETGKMHSDKKTRIVWPWAVNVEGAGYFFTSKKEAISFVRKQLAGGASSIDVGCMQVNLKHHANAFRSLEEAFDPRSNIAYGAQFLRSKYDQLGCWHKAIAHYHSATERLGSKYKDSVIKIARNIETYKDPFRKHAKNYSTNKAYNKSVERGYNRALASNNAVNERRHKSRMMVHVPKPTRTYYR